MRLKSLWIEDFKNLKDFTINFEDKDGITVLIGNNASGKSNVLEAISAIFKAVYENTIEAIPFKFTLEYQIDKFDILVSKKNKALYRYKNSKNKTWETTDALFGRFDGKAIEDMYLAEKRKDVYKKAIDKIEDDKLTFEGLK